jgi:hypothetical protein
VAGQFGNFFALVFSEGHFADQQQLEVFGFHRGATLANIAGAVAWRIKGGGPA